jgi:hypothetical protein
MSEGLVHLPSKGFFETMRDSKKEKHCLYCKKECIDNKWWDIFSFKKYTEIGKDAKTGEWLYVCDDCTKRFVKDLVKQFKKVGK